MNAFTRRANFGTHNAVLGSWKRTTGAPRRSRASIERDIPAHGVTACFVGEQLELLEPLGAESPIAAFLERHPAGGLHHVCHEVSDVAAAARDLERRGFRVLAPPARGADDARAAAVERSLDWLRRPRKLTMTETVNTSAASDWSATLQPPPEAARRGAGRGGDRAIATRIGTRAGRREPAHPRSARFEMTRVASLVALLLAVAAGSLEKPCEDDDPVLPRVCDWRLRVLPQWARAIG